jgi:hypothetical protein
MVESDNLRAEIDAIEKLQQERACNNPYCKKVPPEERMQVALARSILLLCDKFDAAKKPTAFELLSRAGIINAL